MADFSFVHDLQTDGWIISAPRRATRPNAAKGTMHACPFCPAHVADQESVYEVKASGISPQSSVDAAKSVSRSVSQTDETQTDTWLIKVVKNKFPFAPIHEVLILTPEHNKALDMLSFHQMELIMQTYRQRFQTYEHDGQVYIFHNHGPSAGESIPHAHSQLAVIPHDVNLRIPPPIATHVLPISAYQETDHYRIHCPSTAVWSDEVWISAKRAGKTFSETTDDELSDLTFVLGRLLKIYRLRYANDFPFNFYIYPGRDWYMRLIPRKKTLGGFEVGTSVFVNTQDPQETIAFIREHFMTPNEEKILREHQADYHFQV